MLKDFTKTPETTVIAIVKSVDEDEWIIDAEPIEQNKIFNIRLKAVIDTEKGGIIEVPEVDSKVLIGFIYNDPDTAYVLKVNKVSKILMIGGDNGGLIKIDDLKSQYDANIAAIKSAVSAGFAALAGLDGGASSTAFNSAAATILNLNKTTLENTKIKH